ncbi:hypothetical protein BSKO_05648 [Bryopsis sp. KO-2023]|nr:hypothetical protein BSKO_05648 [Bryopsis sp. KO-2023]
MEASTWWTRVLVVCSLASVVVSENICALECVQDVYARNCGGGRCVRSYSGRKEREGLCSDTCIEAIHGKEFLECLIESDTSRKDWKKIQFRTIGKEVLNLCGKMFPLEKPPPPPSPPPPPPPSPPTPPPPAPAPAPEEEPPAPEPEVEPPAPEPEMEAPAPAPEEDDTTLVTVAIPKSEKHEFALIISATGVSGETAELFNNS